MTLTGRMIRKLFKNLLGTSLVFLLITAAGPARTAAPLASQVSNAAPVLTMAREGGVYRVSFGGAACLEFDIPSIPGCAAADVSVTNPADAAGPAPSAETSPAKAFVPPPAATSSMAQSAPVEWRHVVMRWKLPATVRSDEIAIRFRWLGRPDFWWAPHLAPRPGYVIAQHVFRSPAVIAQSGPLTAAVVPDLDLVGRDPGAPWFLDLDAPASESKLGLCRTDVADHVLFRRAPGLTLGPGTVEIAFYVTAYRDDGRVRDPWFEVGRFLWDRWARPLERAGEPIGAPLDDYVSHTYRWAFDSWKKFTWQEFDLGGRRVGAPQFIVNVSQSPGYPGEWYQREFLSIWNQAWFSSLRSASGLYRYARRTGDERLRRMSLLTKELALAAPQRDGFFPSVIRTDNVEVEAGGKKIRRPKGWETAYWTNSDRCPVNYGITPDWYHVLDMSWTALLMVRWYEDLDRDRRLLDYARTYADKLLTLQDENGFFPGWLEPRTLRPGAVMNETPETSLSATFLLALAKATGRASYREAGLKAVVAVVRDIVPAGRWEDFETYWSCCPWGSDFYLDRKIARNAMYKQCSFSMFWTAEALLAAFRETGDRRYLDWGRRTLDELAMVQQVWQPPFIHVPALGGFGVMNCDGEWNDSRETLFAELFLDYYRATGDAQLFERGVAALRAGFIMMDCPENPAVKTMWEKVYPWFGPADYGFTMENYGHGGKTSAAGEGMGSFTIYDWGNGAAAEAANRILDHYGQVYVDRARGQAFGVDGVDVTKRTGGWDVKDRTGRGRTLRVVFEDGGSMRLATPGRIASGPAK